jgi:hypothetical protein
MADINVVRRKSRVYPLLIGVGSILAVALLLIVWGDYGTDAVIDTRTVPLDQIAPEIQPGQPGPAFTEEIPAEVAAYRTFTESTGTSGGGPSHAYTTTGLRRLSAAIRAVAGPGVAANESLSTHLAAFDEQADRLQADPQSPGQAGAVRGAFLSAADAIASIQQQRFSDSKEMRTRVVNLRQMAEGIETNRPLTEQQERVNGFFASSAEMLEMMARR